MFIWTDVLIFSLSLFRGGWVGHSEAWPCEILWEICGNVQRRQQAQTLHCYGSDWLPSSGLPGKTHHHSYKHTPGTPDHFTVTVQTISTDSSERDDKHVCSQIHTSSTSYDRSMCSCVRSFYFLIVNLCKCIYRSEYRSANGITILI